MSGVIEQDMVASVHYTGKFLDGTVFDSSEGREPLSFLVGHGQMITGFEHELMGASVGEKREFTLTPDQAYGERDENNVQKMDRKIFPEGMDIQVGMVMGADSDQGPIQFSVSEVDDDTVTVDFNHQMAGMTLCFSVEVVEVRPAAPEEIMHGHAHGPGGHQH